MLQLKWRIFKWALHYLANRQRIYEHPSWRDEHERLNEFTGLLNVREKIEIILIAKTAKVELY